jgi:hypothetical protein
MEPVEVVGIVLVGGEECQPSVAVNVDDVLGAGSGFSECEISVLNHGSLTEWVEIFDRLWREDGGTLVED